MEYVNAPPFNCPAAVYCSPSHCSRAGWTVSNIRQTKFNRAINTYAENKQALLAILTDEDLCEDVDMAEQIASDYFDALRDLLDFSADLAGSSIPAPAVWRDARVPAQAERPVAASERRWMIRRDSHNPLTGVELYWCAIQPAQGWQPLRLGTCYDTLQDAERVMRHVVQTPGNNCSAIPEPTAE